MSRRSAPDVFYREFPIESVRAVEGKDRTYEFVVATEAPVDVGIGRPEVLRMRGADLKRMKPTCSVLDTHDHGIRSILGKAKVRVDGKRMLAEIELDPSPEGDAAKIRLDSGSLRTASIGYRVNRAESRELRAGEHDGAGDGRVEGPAVVQRSWAPHEITLCPVPADERAVRIRSFNKRSPVKFSDLPGQQPADELDADNVEQHTDEAEQERAAPTPPPAKPKAKPAAKPQPVTLLPLERLRREAAAITPKGLEAVTERALLEDDADIDTVRAALKKAAAKRMKPLGTPEPVEEPEQGAEDAAKDQAERALTPEAVERTLKGLRS